MTLTEIIHGKLIEFFANHSVDEIQGEGGNLLKRKIGAGSYKKIKEDREYKNFFDALLELRAVLEVAIEGETGLQQVKWCLSLLHEKRKSKRDFELLTMLIKKGIYKREWNREQKKYFDLGVEMMGNWKDYFLSYTNRNFNETNNCLKAVLNEVLDPVLYDSNRDRSNCVAHLIKKYLDENGLDGFFDKHDMITGDEIKKKIRNHCRSAFAFVQLLEMVMFTGKKDGRNWCYEEFDAFSLEVEKTGQENYNRYYFIHPYKKNVLFPADLPPEYKKWKTKIIETLFLDDLRGMNEEKIRYQMWKLATEIKTTRERMLKDYYTELPIA